MGANDHIFDSSDTTEKCSHCGKKYRQWIEDQVPGFRSKDYDRCPYCGESNGSSMEVEFNNSKIN